MKERQSLVWNCTHQWPSWLRLGKNSIEKGHGWVRFHTRLSLSFNFSWTIFALVKLERESLGTTLELHYFFRSKIHKCLWPPQANFYDAPPSTSLGHCHQSTSRSSSGQWDTKLQPSPPLCGQLAAMEALQGDQSVTKGERGGGRRKRES